MDDNKKNIEQYLKDIKFDDAPDHGHRDLLEKKLLLNFNGSGSRQNLLWRTIMNNKITKLAVAAVFVVAVMAGISLIGNTSNIALADVLENIMQYRTYSCLNRMDMIRTPGAPESMPPSIESEALFSFDQGMVVRAYILDDQGNREKLASETYAILSERALINIIPEKKLYIRVNITDQRWEEVGKELANPSSILEEFMKKPYTELGPDVVDGIDVIGFESTKADVTTKDFASSIARIWIDSNTELPVKIEVRSFNEDGELVTKVVASDYQWGVSVEPEDFIPNIPDDYEKLADVEIDVGEKNIMDGLAFFVELTGGKYPSELSMMSFAKEVRDAMIVKHNGEPPRPDQETLQKLINLELILNFYNKLVASNQSPAYYGKTVTPQFPHAVLMRWRIEDGRYKVIFGDLSIEEVSETELQELEATPLNLDPFAINPFPKDGETFGSALNDLNLNWIPGAYVTKHIVYMGTDPDNLELIAETEDAFVDRIEAIERDFEYYWRVDEVQPDGSVVTGDIWTFNTGSLRGQWTQEEMYFDGVEDYVSIPALNLNSNTVTMTAWINRDGDQPEHTTGLVFCRSQETGAGLSLGHYIDPEGRWISSNRLAYNWNNDPRTWRWTTDLFVPDNQWVFVGLVLEPDKATLYLGHDGKLQSAVNETWHFKEEFDAEISIGDDPHFDPPGMNRHFKGSIKNVRVYDYALSQTEIETIFK